ncbi:MAG: head GIN domain-containing protein [Sphingomicrobium sp.]
MRRPLSPIAFVAAACASTAACGGTRAENAGPDSSREFAVGNFTTIEVAGPYDVHVHTGGKSAASAKGPQNILAHMVVEVDGSTLRIHPKRGAKFGEINWGRHSPVTVEVSTQSLNAAALGGSGDMAIDRISGSSFKGAIGGSGSLKIAALDVGTLKFAIGGSGEIDASGKAAEAEYAVAGSGSVRNSGLDTANLTVAIAGSGDVAAHATSTAKISIMGSGDVTVTGGAKCEISKMGSGSANCS